MASDYARGEERRQTCVKCHPEGEGGGGGGAGVIVRLKCSIRCHAPLTISLQSIHVIIMGRKREGA